MATSTAVSSEGLVIPLIDFSHFLNGTPTERKAIAQAILTGFQTAGFIYLKNHTIPLSVVKHTFSRSSDFFAQGDDLKKSVDWTTPQANRGYSAPGREKVSQLATLDEVDKIRTAAPDLKESFEMGREGEEGHPNRWPEEKAEGLKDFKSDMQNFFGKCKDMHVEVMRAIAVGMGLDEDFFDRFVDVGDNTLRLLHYPAVDTKVFKVNPNAVRAGEHSVSHLLGLCLQVQGDANEE